MVVHIKILHVSDYSGVFYADLFLLFCIFLVVNCCRCNLKLLADFFLHCFHYIFLWLIFVGIIVYFVYFFIHITNCRSFLHILVGLLEYDFIWNCWYFVVGFGVLGMLLAGICSYGFGLRY